MLSVIVLLQASQLVQFLLQEGYFFIFHQTNAPLHLIQTAFASHCRLVPDENCRLYPRESGERNPSHTLIGDCPLLIPPAASCLQAGVILYIPQLLAFIPPS